MSWDPDNSFEELADAVSSNNKSKVRELINSLVSYVYTQYECYDPNKAGRILNVLRRRRFFEEMRRAADAFLNNGCQTFKIRKYYAQALIDLGYLTAAENVLLRLRNDANAVYLDSAKELNERSDAEEQWAEACGLLGRVNKDRFVNAKNPRIERNQEALNEAIKYYYVCYTINPRKMSERHWHGINAVGLARLAHKKGVRVEQPFDTDFIAATILKEIKELQKVNENRIDIWAAANAMEACIALRQWEEAYGWAKEYVDPKADRARHIDAFEVAGTLRQLEEVWQIKIDEEPGGLLIALLRTRLQQLEGFTYEIKSAEIISREFLAKQANDLERRFGGNFLSFRSYCSGVNQAKAVARIGPSAEEHFGTGFLIEGGDLHPKLTGQRLLMTCDHVVSNSDLSALLPNRAIVTFRADDNSIKKFGVDSVLWSRPQGDLDVSILRLDGNVDALPVVSWAQALPNPGTERVLIFGHAEGGTLSFSLGDNHLVDRNERFLQYRAPTVNGSSGSPVFNTDWGLIAVHHRGGFALKQLSGEGIREANQGTSVFAIRQAVQDDPQLLPI